MGSPDGRPSIGHIRKVSIGHHLAKHSARRQPNQSTIGVRPSLLFSCPGTHVTDKPPRHLVRIVYWSGMGPNVEFKATIRSYEPT